MNAPRLGLGLIAIGRPWPVPDSSLPTDGEVVALLDTAIEEGITFFDTAAAYGTSETRLGHYLKGLDAGWRDRLIVATKCGEFWNQSDGSVTDHSPGALERSVTRSEERLGRIDVLQLHQADVQALRDETTLRTLRDLQEAHAIAALGASVKTPEAAQAALDAGLFTRLQMPINSTVPQLVEWAMSHHEEITVIGNRPYASGQQVGSKQESLAHAAAAVGKRGVVITGTTKAQHLRESVSTWKSLN